MALLLLGAAMLLPACSRSSEEAAAPVVVTAHGPDTLPAATQPVGTQPSSQAWVTCVISPGAGRVDSSEIVVTFTNTSDVVLRLLRQNLLMEQQLTNPHFKVRHNGLEVRYTGRLVKRGPYGPLEYVFLEPGRRIQSKVRLSEWYAISGPGSYDCVYRTYNTIENPKKGFFIISGAYTFTMK